MTTRVLASCAILALLSLGCATRLSTQAPQVTVVWGDAYTLECAEGQTITGPEGDVVACEEGRSVEVRGGHIGEAFAAMWDSIVAVLGALVPRGMSP